jgi:hypothetical protein
MPRLKPRSVSPLPALIGWRERVRLPQLAVGMIVAKVDTGAKSAALHAENIRVHGTRVRFRVPLNGRDHEYDLPLAGHRRVKSTSGHSEARAVIETDVVVGEHRFATEVTLTDRTDMGVPMLLGRSSIKGRFVVHPGKSFILSRKRKRKAP